MHEFLVASDTLADADMGRKWCGTMQAKSALGGSRQDFSNYAGAGQEWRKKINWHWTQVSTAHKQCNNFRMSFRKRRQKSHSHHIFITIFNRYAYYLGRKQTKSNVWR